MGEGPRLFSARAPTPARRRGPLSPFRRNEASLGRRDPDVAKGHVHVVGDEGDAAGAERRLR